jgi:Bax protein
MLACLCYPLVQHSAVPKVTNNTSSLELTNVQTPQVSAPNFLPNPAQVKSMFGVEISEQRIRLKPNFKTVKPIPDFALIEPVMLRKKAYFTYIAQAVDQINAVIEQQRKFVQLIDAQLRNDPKYQLLPQERDAWIFLLEEYRVKDSDLSRQVTTLLRRVDTIPKPLVLVQTANESGWGTSRFAQLGYNFFGLWCYREGCGFVPKMRPAGANYEVAKFSSLPAATYAYMRNLNRNPAYAEMRQIRAKTNDQDTFKQAYAMIEGLKAYSQRGSEYIEELHAMLRVNREFL